MRSEANFCRIAFPTESSPTAVKSVVFIPNLDKPIKVLHSAPATLKLTELVYFNG